MIDLLFRVGSQSPGSWGGDLNSAIDSVWLDSVVFSAVIHGVLESSHIDIVVEVHIHAFQQVEHFLDSSFDVGNLVNIFEGPLIVLETVRDFGLI